MMKTNKKCNKWLKRFLMTLNMLSLNNWLGVLLGLQLLILSITDAAKYPFNLKATFHSGRVKVTWDAVHDAYNYTLYKRNMKTEAEEQLTTTNTTIEVQHADKDWFMVSTKLVNEVDRRYSKYVGYYQPKTEFSKAGSSVSFDIQYKAGHINKIENKDKKKTLFDIRNNIATSVDTNYAANITTAGVSSGKVKLSMTIKDVRMVDAGYIVGCLNNEEKTDTGVILVVIEFTKPIVNGPQEVQNGNTANLTCSTILTHRPNYFVFKRQMKYIWFRNNTKLQNQQRENVLTINRINSSEQIIAYTCRVKIKGFNSVMSDPFIFQTTSTIRGIYINDTTPVQNGETVSVSEGQCAHVTCSADGYPGPSISWKRNSKKVSEIKVTQKTAQFSVINPTCGDLSNFSCEASNKGGKDSRYFTLVVFCPPEIHDFKRDYEQEFPAVKTLSFEVRSKPKPNVTVTFNDDKVLNYTVKIVSKSSFTYNMFLTLALQYGNYSVTLTNKIGSKTYAFHVSLPEKAIVSSSADIKGQINTPSSLVVLLAVSGGVLVIAVTIVIVILKWKLSKRPQEMHNSIQKPRGTATEDIPSQEGNGHSSETSVTLSPNDVCASVNKPSCRKSKANQDGNDTLPEISIHVTPNDLYASVNKPSWRKSNRGNKPEVREDGAAAAMSKVNEVETSMDLAASGRNINPDGLIYIDVAFNKVPKEVSEPPVIHGNDEKTIYTTISHVQGGATCYPDDD